MAIRNEVYKCAECGNIVEVTHGAGGVLVCCGKPMNLMPEKSADSATEKHVPVIEKINGGYKVTVGSTLHPMAEDHWIEWIELLADGKSYTQYLNPGDEPVAVFMVDAAMIEKGSVTAREYCNKHGLWKTK